MLRKIFKMVLLGWIAKRFTGRGARNRAAYRR